VSDERSRGKAPPYMRGVETRAQKREAMERLARAKATEAKRRKAEARPPAPTFDQWEREEQQRGKA